MTIVIKAFMIFAVVFTTAVLLTFVASIAVNFLPVETTVTYDVKQIQPK